MQNKEPPFYINENSIELKNQDPTLTKSMNFDFVFDELSNTKDIYDKLLSEMVPSVCEGYNVTTFAYGQTASGKTFTMKGTNDKPGLIRLAIRDVFDQIKNSEGENRTFLIRVSYLEIYNEKVRDLLSPEQRYVNIFVDKNKNLSFDHLTEEIVRSEQETMDIISRGTSHIMVAKTVANDASSRSHTIFRMIVERKDELAVDNAQQLQSSLAKKAKSKQIVRIGNLNLVDLAGSENSSEQADYNRKREGQNINLSLLHLKEIITKLSNGEKVTSFRNSKLTRILGDSLGGNARVAVVCAISPDPVKLKETKRTLEFGSNAQKISIKPTVNSECDNALIMKYQTELETLQSELAMLKDKLTNQSNTQVEKEETEEEVKELERIMSDLTDSMVTNKSLEARLQDIEKEKRDHEERIRQMEEERAKLQELLQIEEERKRMQEEESKSKEETLYLLQQETASMSLQLEEIISSKNNIEAESKRRELQIHDLMNYNQLLEQKTINEESSRRRAEEMISDQNKQIESFKQVNEHFEREYQKEKMAKEEASKVIQQKMEEMQNMQQQLSSTRTEKENYEMQIKTLNDNMSAMYNMWKEDFDREISIREKEKNQLDEQIARLTSLLEERDLEIKKLQENCKTQDYLQHFVDTLEKDMKSYKQQLEISEIELSSTKKKSLDTFRDNIELKKKVTSLENELEALKLHFIVNFGQESLPKSPKPNASNSSNFFEANNISIPLGSNTNQTSSSNMSNVKTPSAVLSSLAVNVPPPHNQTNISPTSSPTLSTTATVSNNTAPSVSQNSSGPVPRTVQPSSTISSITSTPPLSNASTPLQNKTPSSVGSTPVMNSNPIRPSTPVSTTPSYATPQKTPTFNSTPHSGSTTSSVRSTPVNSAYSTPPPLSNTFSPVRPSTPTVTPPQYNQQTTLSQQISSNYQMNQQLPSSRPVTSQSNSSTYSSNPFNNSIGGMREETKTYSNNNPYEYYPSTTATNQPSNTGSYQQSNSYNSTNPHLYTTNNIPINNQRSQYSVPNSTTGNRLSINTQNVQPSSSVNQRGLDSPTMVNIPPSSYSRPQSTGSFQPRQGSLPPSPMQNNRVSLPQQTQQQPPVNSFNNNFTSSQQSTQQPTNQPPPFNSSQSVNQQSALVRNRPRNFNTVPSTGNLYPTLPATHSSNSSSINNNNTHNTVSYPTPTVTSSGGNSRPPSPSVYRVTGEKAFKAKEEREQNEEPEGPIVGINEKSGSRPKRSLSISKLIGLVRGDDKNSLK
ncbi:kinesin-7 [Naegleria gruberi]|uniref:Kinesin-7 n=1 Tax=Naegleria gruberi TaxID=5762 RepID=D2VZ06_NAEGR|nr:kinesin-7 [Naegleria gruberi]EFC37907.1 kinesin-7 [Naegleria gruberi]|eukprot:XP_002670651.1 kinesin-7 [Naegleria gruberi]